MKREKVVCNCMSVTVGMIEEAIDSGASTLEEVQAITQAGTVCCGCADDVERVVKALVEEKQQKEV